MFGLGRKLNMNFYKKYILPRFLNYEMKKESFIKDRQEAVEQVSGVVLEIGFGSGLNLPYYKNITKLYGLDPSLELFKLAKERIEKVAFPFEYINVGAERIPLTDNSIDTVISTWNFCSISDPDLALKEISRVLKPNGKFVFVEHGKSSRYILAVLQNILTPFSKIFTGGCHLDREIDQIIINNDFQIAKLDTFPEKYKPLIFNYKGVAVSKK